MNDISRSKCLSFIDIWINCSRLQVPKYNIYSFI